MNINGMPKIAFTCLALILTGCATTTEFDEFNTAASQNNIQAVDKIMAKHNWTACDGLVQLAESDGWSNGVADHLLNSTSPNCIGSNEFQGKGPLFVAARRGQFQLVQKLVEHHASVNVVDSAGWTPLDYANKGNQFAVANYLQSHGFRASLSDDQMAASKGQDIVRHAQDEAARKKRACDSAQTNVTISCVQPGPMCTYAQSQASSSCRGL